MRTRVVLLAGLAAAAIGQGSRADLFVYREKSGETVEVEARLVGTGRGAMVLELADGQYRIIPEGAVEKREVKDGPEPLDEKEIAEKLQKRFGENLFRSLTRDPFVIGLVLQAPLPKSSESRAQNFLLAAAKFMKNVDGAFASFVREARVATRPATHPLVVLIFESKDDFDKYADSITGGQGLSANRIAGFYSGITNYLAIRMGECHTFDVPLHEAIHQQVYNRHVFERLAPIPHWFDEGIATGFEATKGRISIGPTKISPRYARQVLAAQKLTFREVVTDDNAFAGDVLAGEAYGNAWALHWLLVTKYRSAYGKYVRLLSQKQVLEKEDAEQRLADFREAFGKDLSEIEKEFRPFLNNGLKKQRVDLNPERQPGILHTQQDVGEVDLTAIDRDGKLFVEGTLMNISPLRAMSFHVTAETDGGTYADWHIPSLEIGKSISLEQQIASKLMGGVKQHGKSKTFRVKIHAAPPESEEAGKWRNGALPVPVYAQQKQ
jgi:hypothetical protein